MNTSRFVVVCAFALLAATSLAAVLSSSKQCLLNSNGKPICSFFKGDEILPSVRQSSCGSGDNECMCQKGVELTNAIRRKNGKTNDLRAGPESMLNNAVEHSTEMKNGLGLEHQELDQATKKVGCGVFINRENIAMNGGMDVDPIVQCMKQWEESPGHFANIMADNDYVVVGAYSDGGENWCTQTFGSQDTALPGSGNCGLVGSGGSGSAPDTTTGAPSTTESMEKPVTEKHFMTQKMEEPVTTKKMEEPVTTKKMEEPVTTKKIEEPVTTKKMEEPNSTKKMEEEETTTKSNESPERSETKPCPEGGNENESAGDSFPEEDDEYSGDYKGYYGHHRSQHGSGMGGKYYH